MLGLISIRQQQYQHAVRYLEQAMKANPNAVEAPINLGRLHGECLDHARAAEVLEKALAIDPRHPIANNNYGLVLSALGRYEEAVLHVKTATSVAPDYADAWHNQGNILSRLGRYGEALHAYDRAFRLDPASEETEGARLFAKLQVCDWSNFDAERTRLLDAVRNRRLAAPPLKMLTLSSDPGEQLQCAALFSSKRHPSSPQPSADKSGAGDGRIRVAYVSYDFRPHPMTYLIAGLIEAHDRTQFDVIGVSLHAEDPSDIGQRMKNAFAEFIDASKLSDQAIVRMMHERGIDIAIDLMGHTDGGRPSIFAMRAAPVQVAYLGYLGTTGADYIDYMIADEILVPDGARPYYREKMAYLPSYQANDRKRHISDKAMSRSDFGLPADAFVFCCFNNSYKISPATFGSWMNVLNDVDGAVLWLLADNDDVVRKPEARSCGARRRRRQDRLLEAGALRRIPGPIPARGSVRRHQPAQFGRNRERCVVGRLADADPDRRDLCGTGCGEPAHRDRSARADRTERGGL